MQTPQRRDRVEEDMLAVDGQIEQHDRERDADERFPWDIIDQGIDTLFALERLYRTFLEMSDEDLISMVSLDLTSAVAPVLRSPFASTQNTGMRPRYAGKYEG